MSTRRNVLKLAARAAAIGSIAGSIQVLAQAGALAQASPLASERVALKGYDPVAYFTLSTPTPGVGEYEYVYDGARYLFANARHRDLFKANPEKYAPQFGGNCANNMANGVRRDSDPTIWVIVNDRLYVHPSGPPPSQPRAGGAGPPPPDRFRKEGETVALKASANWKTLRNTPSQ